MSLGGLPGSLRLNVSDVSVSQGPAPPLSHSLPVTMSQMSQCLGALPPSVSQPRRHNVSMSLCLMGGLPGPAWQCLNVSMSQGGLPGPARSVSMSQCLGGVCLGQHGASQCLSCLGGVCLGQHGASQCLSCLGGVCLGQHGASQRLNVSVVSAGSAWASSALSMSQCLSCLRGGLLGPARRVSMSQCLSVSGRSAWGRSGPAQPRLNVSVPQGGLPGGDQDQRSPVSMSQCLREVCLGETRTSVAASQSRVWASIQNVGEQHPERRRASRASASIQSIGESPEHRQASTSLHSIGKHQSGIRAWVWEGNPKKKLDRPYLNRARHPSRRNSPLNTLRAQGGCRAA